MTNTNTQLKALVSRARVLYAQGSRRHLVVRRENGSKLFELNLALAVVLGLVTLLFAAWALILGGVAGYLLKLRIEIISEADDTIIVDKE